jgi:ABC-type polysaccharide/polyol phosphate transport system ATPase subunit
VDYAVSVKNLTKKYKLYTDKWGPIKEVLTKNKLHKEFLALNNITLNFPKGEAIGVLGTNGSGKSTLLKIITGIADPTTGTVEVNGSLVFLDVSSGIDPELTGYDNIFMKGILMGYTKENMMSKVDEIIEFSELGEFIHQPVKNYSSGMRAKLGFAISVNVNPDILIVDEALAVGDAKFRDKGMKKMNEFKEQGKTIIFVSHDKNAVESFCSKAAWIHQGELITYGDSKLIGSIYNDFMSGKKDIDTIRSEVKFSHSIEQVSMTMSKTGFSLEFTGYLYSLSEEDNEFDLKVTDLRTGESIIVPLHRTQYGGNASLPSTVDQSAGFSCLLEESEFPSFFKPGKYSFLLRYRTGKGLYNEFPFFAGQAKFEEEENSIVEKGRYVYKAGKENNKLVLTIDNRDKVQQQINKIWFNEHSLHIEGIAFVRGYETPTAESAQIMLHLVNMETFKTIDYPAILGKTDEITENQAFNPQGKNYNFSKFNADINISDLEPGKYESKISYQMCKEPNHEFLILAWASKSENYPNESYHYNNREIEILTPAKYLQIEIKETN